MKKIIVTGGAGFIGTSLVKALLRNDVEKILIIDDLSTGSKSNLDNLLSDNKIEFIHSKIEDIENINKVFQNYDFCYHLAAGVGVQYIMDNLSAEITKLSLNCFLTTKISLQIP